MDQNQMTALERIEALGNVLDKLGDLPGGGRSKCGLIWVANDVLNGLRGDVLILEDKLKVLEGKKEPAPEVKLEVVKNEEDGNDEETADETDSEEA